MRSSSRTTRRPLSDVSTTSARHSRVKSSTTTSTRKRRPSASTLEAKSRLQRWFRACREQQGTEQRQRQPCRFALGGRTRYRRAGDPVPPSPPVHSAHPDPIAAAPLRNPDGTAPARSAGAAFSSLRHRQQKRIRSARVASSHPHTGLIRPTNIAAPFETARAGGTALGYRRRRSSDLDLSLHSTQRAIPLSQCPLSSHAARQAIPKKYLNRSVD